MGGCGTWRPRARAARSARSSLNRPRSGRDPIGEDVPWRKAGAKAESMAPATGNLSSGRSGSDVTNGLAERWKSAAIRWPILRLLKHSRSNAYDRGAAFAADGVQTGAVRLTAAQTAASSSSSALSAAPTSTAALDSQAQVIRPTTAPSEP